MAPHWFSALASIGMAIGPPLVYVDQTTSIIKKKDSTGFSRDVCAVLLLANITRCFFWLGERFELALLVQSLLMVLCQLALLYICVLYRPRLSPENFGVSSRPLGFWQWTTYSQHIEFLAGYIVLLTILVLIFGRSDVFVWLLGFFSLGLESTLPLPQFISNYNQKSLYGFRMSTLIGWVGGDSFKTVYFFAKGSPLQFKICAIFQLSVDIAIVVQRLIYGNAPPPAALTEEDELEQALALAEE
ncbi:hypothetical protein F5148DRAFT_1280643 [Russula earlei]|uniref:Uncharacterized protein n=1 Tax=Russula earlei TaxID=71964 RepID=A0ACC0UIJ0_9AGAM|nr:hypothetical protein F5148DRAFT_1280643 [Russula earlei]